MERVLEELERWGFLLGEDLDVLKEWLTNLKVHGGPSSLLLFWRDKHRACESLDYLDRDLELLMYESSLAAKLKNPRVCADLVSRALLKALGNVKATGLGLEIVPLRRLIEEAKPIDYLCRPLIPKRALVLLAGKAGIGKSFICLHVAHAIASASKVFDHFDVVESSRVLLIDEENSPSIYKERIKAMGLNPPDNIDCLSFSGFKLDNPEHLKFIEFAVKSEGYGLIVLDNWTKLVAKVDENNAVEVSKVLSALRRMAYELDCAFILVHHLRKSPPPRRGTCGKTSTS